MNEAFTKGHEMSYTDGTPLSAFLPWFFETEGEFALEPCYEPQVATSLWRVRRAGYLTHEVQGVIDSLIGLSRIGQPLYWCC